MLKVISRLLCGMCIVFSAAVGAAAELTGAQLLTLKNDINANFLAQWNAGDTLAIADAYNQLAIPAFVVWRSDFPATEYREALVWTEFTGRNAGERDMFAFLTSGGSIGLDCTKMNVRQAINDAFSGVSGVTSRTNLTAQCKRSVLRGERLYATGTGTTLVPGEAPVEGTFSEGNIIQAMGL